MEKLVFAADHAGYGLKEFLIKNLKHQDKEIKDLGTHNNKSVDYPDYALKLADFIKDNRDFKGVLICGSGIGIAIAANRFNHIRAGLCHDKLSSRLARQHNNANVLVFGARIIDKNDALEILNVFLTTKFEQGRHKNRLDKLAKL